MPLWPGPFGLAVSPSRGNVVSANGGPQRYSLTLLAKDKQYWRAGGLQRILNPGPVLDTTLK